MHLNTKKKVTVLMPVYNGEKYLQEAIESILNQTFTDFELIIINDGSTDSTLDIIMSYKDPRIRLVQNESNLKLIVSLNKGIGLANGMYIARMDSDDVSLPQRLEKQVAFMDSHPEVGVCGTGIRTIDLNGEIIGEYLFPSSHNVIKWRLFFDSPIVHPSTIMRRELLVQIGGYDIYSEYVEDYDLWIRLSKITKLANLQESLLLLRKHGTNITKIKLKEHLINCARTDHLWISEFLGENVSEKVVEQIFIQSKESKKVDKDELEKLIKKLYYSFILKTNLTLAEKRAINKDVFFRLRNYVVPRNILTLLIWTISFNPTYLLDLMGSFSRKIRKISSNQLIKQITQQDKSVR